MATVKQTIEVEVIDKGSTAKVTKEAEKLNSTLAKAAKTAGSMNAAGGTPGSRALAATAAVPKGSQAVMSEQEYGKARGSAGVTGASARDFAKQSEGLGGIVRLYATYAANVYAVGAAFRALSTAMDTSNMVKGLDQLGASSGIALGSLSKQLVKTTDGALSLRDAMETVAKASSSGMSSKNILRMGVVAKEASQALGIDMADAMSRITRASTKLEPELVDELGLFTKTGKASEDYAKSIGKSVSQLSDFERRMAYSNALLAEGEKKFGEIDIDTNPYTKLAATLKDVAQSGLDLINNVLAPIAGYLSKSPVALALGLAAIGSVLLKQALPAIGQFKEGLAQSAEQAKEMAVKKAADAAKAMSMVNEQILQKLGDIADDKVAAVDAAERKVLELQKAGISKASKAYKLLQMDIREVTEEHIRGVEERAKAADTAGKTKEAAVYREVATAVREQKLAEEDFINTKAERLQQTAKEMQQHGVLRATMEAARKSEESATKKQIISNAAYNGSLIGVRNAMVLMRAELSASGLQLTKFGTIALIARGYVAVLAGAVTTLAAALGNVLSVVGIFIAVFTFLDSVFSKNSKQASEFNSALEMTESTLGTLNSTFDKISKKDPLEKLSTASLSAKSTALMEVADAVKALVTDLEGVDKAASGWDRFLDGIKSVWGGDVRTKFSESMSATVLGTLTKLAGSPEAEATKKKLAGILNIDPKASTATWTAAFARIAQDVDKTNAVAAAMRELTTASGDLANRSAEADAALKSSSTVLGDLITKFKSKDEVANFGTSLVAASTKIAAAMKSPELAIQQLYEISSDVNKLSLFDSSDQANLIKYASSIREVNAAYQAQKQVVEASQQNLAKLKLTDKTSFAEGGNVATYDKATKAKISAEEKVLAAAQAKLKEEAAKVFEIQAKFPDLAANQFARGAKLVEASIVSAMSKASTEFASAVLGAVGDVPGIAEQRTKLALQQVNSETNLLKAQYDLIRTTKENTAIQAVRATQEELTQRKGELSAARAGDTSNVGEIQKQVSSLEVTLSERKGVAAVYSQGGGTKALDAVKAGIAGGNKEMLAQGEDLLNYINSLTNLSAQIATQADKAAAKVFEGRVAGIQELANAEKRKLQDAVDAVELGKKQNELLQQTGRLTEADLLRENAKLDATKETNSALIKQQDISARLQTLVLSLDTGKLSEKARSNTLAEIERLKKASTTAGSEAEATNAANAIKLEKNLLDITLSRLQHESSLQDIKRKGTEAQQDATTTERELSLQTAQDTGKYTKEYLDLLTYELEAYKIAEEAKRQESQLTAKFNMQQSELGAKYAAEMQISGGKGTAESSKILDTIVAESIAYSEQVAAIGQTTSAKLASKEATAEAKKEQDAFNASIEALKGLDGIFGGLAASIADVATAFREVSLSQQANLSTVNSLQTAYDKLDDSDPAKKVAAEKALNKAKETAVKSEVSGIGKVAGASKKLFSEKTAAYKAFSAIEKTSQAISLALELKTAAVKIATWMGLIPAKVASEGGLTAAHTVGAATRAPVTFAEIIGNYNAVLPPPWGAIAGAAAGAYFLSLLGVGGGSAKAPPVPTSAQRQETQGTGMGWQVNEDTKELVKVETGLGVFGDSNAKSESVVKSLEILRDNSVEGLSYDNKLLRAMETVADSITGAAQTLYTIPGFRSSTINRQDFGLGKSKEAGGLESLLSDIPLIGGALGGLVGGIFGGGRSATREIQGAGLLLTGTITQLAADTEGSIKQYTNVLEKWQEDGGWFGSDDSGENVISTVGTAAAQTRAAISAIFDNAVDVFTSVGEKAGMTEASVKSALQAYNIGDVPIEIFDLQGQELLDALNAVIGQTLDGAAKSVFTQFQGFKKFGEGYLETAVRVGETNSKVTQALKNMGSGIDLTGTYAVTESLAKLAGGMQDFADQSSFFTENFLDAAAQLAPSQKSVVKTFKDLGLAVPKTRQEFAALVQGLNLADLSTHSTYQTLMDVAPAFDAVSDAAEDAAKTGLETLKSELESSVTSLNSFIEGISKLRASLLLGSQSILTPLEKYGQAKSLFETTYANLSSTDTAIAAAARSSFSDTANSFLEASRTYFASSEQYTSDFNSVLAKLDAAESSAGIQLDNATLQLEALKSQLTVLSNIDNGIAKLAGTTPLQAFAKGGYASGLALVGEYGPEVVDFATPGRVYTADQTAGMFKAPGSGNQQQQAVVAELQAVRQELAQLRKDQQAQTGDLIISNYGANQKAADLISDAVTSSAAETNWLAKTKPTLV